MRNYKINIFHFICVTILLLQLIRMQIDICFPNISGTLYQIIYYMKYLGAGILIFFTLKKRNKNKEIIEKVKRYVKIFLPLFILFVIVEIIACIQSPVPREYGISYWTRMTANILDKITILTEIICISIICGEDAIKCISNTLIKDGLLILLITILKTGIMETFETFLVILGIAEENQATMMLEVHELTYCVGLCILYYLFFDDRKTKGDIVRICILTIIFVLGGKRIGFAGIIIAGIVSLIIHKRNLSLILIKSIGILGTVICMIYVYLLYDGEVLSSLNELGINVMGRDEIYNYYMDRTEFSPTFLGWGIAGVSKTIEHMPKEEVGNMVAVRGLHNDILKIYIEFGFIGSLLWYAFNLIYLPTMIYKKIGKYQAKVYMCLAIYAFITYLTDNTENYFVFQVIFLIIPLLSDRKQKNIVENDN